MVTFHAKSSMPCRLGCIFLCLFCSGVWHLSAGDQTSSLQSDAFRAAVKRISLTRDLETGAHFCNLQLEVSWQPQYKPFYLQAGTIKARFGPDRTGKEVQTEQKGSGSIPVTGKTSTEIDVQVPAPDRSVTTLKSLEGSFSVIVPQKMLRFTFDQLNAAAATKQQEGIKATLREFVLDDDHWTAKIALQYPKAGPTFESHQSWLGNNQAMLEKIGGKQRWNPGGERILRLTSNEAVIEYYFENSSGKKPAQWRLVYDTPGPIVEVMTSFHFKDLPLP
jgi:hypothetical protein